MTGNLCNFKMCCEGLKYENYLRSSFNNIRVATLWYFLLGGVRRPLSTSHHLRSSDQYCSSPLSSPPDSMCTNDSLSDSGDQNDLPACPSRGWLSSPAHTTRAPAGRVREYLCTQLPAPYQGSGESDKNRQMSEQELAAALIHLRRAHWSDWSRLLVGYLVLSGRVSGLLRVVGRRVDR